MQGDVLVSNFNNSANQEGTGTTIVRVNPATDAVTQFAGISDPNCPGGVGLTTALVVLRNGTLNNRIAAIPDAVLRLNDDGTGKTVSKGGDQSVLTRFRSYYRPITRAPAVEPARAAGRS